MYALSVLEPIAYIRRLTKRVRILATNQRSNSPSPLRSDDFQSSRVSVRPRQFLVERWHQFPLMIENFPLIADQYSRVPETANTRFGPLVEPDVRPDIVLRTSLLQRTDLGTIDVQALGSEAVEEGVVVDWR